MESFCPGVFESTIPANPAEIFFFFSLEVLKLNVAPPQTLWWRPQNISHADIYFGGQFSSQWLVFSQHENLMCNVTFWGEGIREKDFESWTLYYFLITPSWSICHPVSITMSEHIQPDNRAGWVTLAVCPCWHIVLLRLKLTFRPNMN